MKQAILLLLIITFLVSCNHEASVICEAAYNYSYAIANYDVEKAEGYATTETRETTLVRSRQLIKAIDTNYIISDTPAQIEITSVKIVNDTEAYAIYHKTTPLKDFSDTLQMRKRKGQWYAHAPIPIVHLPKTLPNAIDSHMIFTTATNNPLPNLK